LETIFDRIQKLCKNRNITIAALERECGLGNATIKKWASSTPSGDKLSRVADYFNVSVDFLLGRELSKKDEKDIKKDLDKIMNKIKTGEDGPLHYNGEEIDPDSLSLLEDAINLSLKQLKIINKEKYNPNKNKK
jgi:transcriptional regulator with XRE-family HTH domain